MQQRTLTLILAASLLAAPVAFAAEPKAPAKVPAAKAASHAPPPQAGRPALKKRPAGDAAIIRTVADAMGFIRSQGPAETTTTINRVQLRGSGKMTVAGTTYTVPKYIYTISLHLKAAREDISRDKGDRLVRVVLDKDAWDEREPGVDGRPASDSALHRRLQLSRTPFGFTRALLDAPVGSVKVTDPGPGGRVTISFPIEGVATTAVLNAEYRPESITQTIDGKTYAARFPAYADLSEYGLMFPTKWTETIDGKPYLDLTINDGRVASYAVFPKPIATTAAN